MLSLNKISKLIDKNDLVKMGIAVVWDILDFTIFRVPGFGTIADVMGGFVALKLAGIWGVAYWWEVFDITDQIDAQIPTMTAIVLATILAKKYKEFATEP